ncbi:MFS transporter [Roseibium sp.]|uniref:MFS transporter n=2 Tax=Roseibium sp. TaxID=1936156 RepID=UPI0032640350
MRLSRAKLRGTDPSGNAERYRLFATLGGLYLAQGIPTYLIAAALPPVLREAGVSRSAIGFFSLLMLPLVLKFLWAPFIDRFSFLKIGHRRGWIVPMQVVTASGIAVLAFIEPTNVTGLFVVCLTMALAMSAQDIATDGYATNSLSEKDRGIGNAFQGGAVALGVVVGGTLSLILFETYGWTPTLLFVAALSLLPLLVTPLMRERVSGPPSAETEEKTISKPSLRAFFMRPEAVQIFVIALIFRASEGLVKAMEGPYLVDVGLSLSWIGYLSGVSAATAGIIGSVIAVGLIKWQGASRSLIILGLLRTICFTAFALHALGIYEPLWTVMSAAAFQTFIRYMEIVILYSLFMSVASRSQPGTDFTLLACAQLIVYLIGSMTSGFIADQFGYDGLFVLAAVLSGLAVLATVKLLSRSSRMSAPHKTAQTAAQNGPVS